MAHPGLSDPSWGLTWSAPVLCEIRWVLTPERLSPLENSVLGGRILMAPEDPLWFWECTENLTLLRWTGLDESCHWFQLGSGTGLAGLHPAGEGAAEGQDCPAEAPWLLSRQLRKVWLRASACVIKLGILLCWRGC